VDAKDESNCSQAIRTRRLTTLLTGVMCATRTNTLIRGQSLVLTLKTSFSKQNNHISEESNQLLLDVVTWTAIILMTDRLPAIGYIVHKSLSCAKMRLSPKGISGMLCKLIYGFSIYVRDQTYLFCAMVSPSMFNNGSENWPGDVNGKGMESANNDARKWPILPFDVSRDFIISKEILV
jgi:hypothetical protein